MAEERETAKALERAATQIDWLLAHYLIAHKVAPGVLHEQVTVLELIRWANEEAARLQRAAVDDATARTDVHT